MVDKEKYKDVDIFVQPLQESGTLTILRGGWYAENPKHYMDEVVSEYMLGKLHNQFVEIHMDIPQVRVIIEGINNLPYVNLGEYLK